MFRFEEVEEEQRELVIPVSNSEEDFDRSSGIYTLRFLVACVDDSLEEEEDMSLQRRVM